MNKQSERATVESLLRWMKDPASSLLSWNRERPDALLRVDDDLVGVEVTVLSEAIPRQAVAPQKWHTEAVRIVRAAQESFEEHDGTALVVRFEFRPGWTPPGRSDLARVANELASIARQAINQLPRRPGEPIQLRDPHPDVRWAYVGRTRAELGGHWAPSFAGHVLRASPDDIKATVRRKDPEVAGYRQAAKSVWLLIDCDLSGQGISLDVPEPTFQLETSFDRVFCCGFGMWEWVEIPVIEAAMAG